MYFWSKVRRYNRSKIHAPMKKRSSLPALALTAALAGLFAADSAVAEKADRNKPMNVEADALRYDDLNQTSLFTGNVVMTKGTLVIRAARVDVKQDPQGFQFGVATGAGGKLAYFRQKREGVDEIIEGEGEVIEYDGKADTVKFIRKAVLRRFRGDVLVDETTGSQINYDNNTDVFTVAGGAANATADNPGGRIRAMLSPKGVASAPAPAAPPASLRPSNGLGAPRK